MCKIIHEQGSHLYRVGVILVFLFTNKMAKEFAKQFYNSTAWKKTRAAYIAERTATDGGLCETCRRNLGVIVHHIKPLTPANISDANISLNQENLKLECKPCHDAEEDHFDEARGERKLFVFFDRNGMPVPKPDSPLPEKGTHPKRDR